MTKRDYIKEIQGIRSRRLKRGSRWEQFDRRFYPVLDLIFELKNMRNQDAEREVLRYIFIALVACLEGYYRLVIKDLVDKNDNCRENIQKIGDLKFNVNTVLAIHKKSVSIGEFVGHLVPLSSFELLNKNLSTITGVDYINDILNIEIEDPKGVLRRIPSDMAKYLKETFDLRNIYCHELAPKKEPIEEFRRSAMRCTIAVYEITFANEVFVKRYIDK